MNTADPEQAELDALLGSPTSPSSKEQIASKAKTLKNQLDSLTEDTPSGNRADLLLDLSGLLVALETKEDDENCWQYAREAFDLYIIQESWGEAVKACDILFESDQPASIVALANGIWLAVTYPVEPELTIRMLEHIIEDTPDKSDGAAIAAISAHYIADIRCGDEKLHNSLTFMTRNLVASVAQKHGKVKTQQDMDAWLDRLHLREPGQFLPRLSRVLDLMVEDQWWFDREELRSKLPES